MDDKAEILRAILSLEVDLRRGEIDFFKSRYGTSHYLARLKRLAA